MLIRNDSNSLKVADDKRLWFVSDLHLNHKKLCHSYPEHFEQTRKYATVEEMNEDLLKNWNETVGKDDVVIFLGDFTLGTPHAQLAQLFLSTMDKLNGQIYCVLGNHDYELRRRLEKIGEDSVFVKYLMIDYQGRQYLAQHHDFDEIRENALDAFTHHLFTYDKELVFVHGHTHSTRQISTFNENSCIQNCVCVDIRYAPIPANLLLGNRIDIENTNITVDVLDSTTAQSELEEDVLHHCFEEGEINGEVAGQGDKQDS